MVLDLRKQAQKGPVNYTLIDLDRLGAGPPPAPDPKDPGELGRRAAARLARSAGRLLGFEPVPAESPEAVILYTAPWCGFCKKAAAHLRQKSVRFVERDIDRDRRAAVELSRKLRQAGLSGGGVPVLDIGGTLIIGFDQQRIDRLLERL